MATTWRERLIWPAMIFAGVVLAAIVWAVWPVASAPAAPPSVRPSVYAPAPVPSELELSVDYPQESPEELGAEPLPGADVTPEPAPVVG